MVSVLRGDFRRDRERGQITAKNNYIVTATVFNPCFRNLCYYFDCTDKQAQESLSHNQKQKEN